jgi:hypothetical protein
MRLSHLSQVAAPPSLVDHAGGELMADITPADCVFDAHSAELQRDQPLRRRATASRQNMSPMAASARMALRQLPEHFDAPPTRRGQPTGTSTMLKPAAVARICISRLWRATFTKMRATWHAAR